MSTRADDIKDAASSVVSGSLDIDAVIEDLQGDSRRKRQVAAATIAEVSRQDASIVIPFGSVIVEALDVPEAQTRWELLDTLRVICDTDADVCEGAVADAETALFDESSGPLRLAAMRFLCCFGATSEDRSDRIWSLVDEGIQCYHGDVEFNEMLIALVDFSGGSLSSDVKSKFKDRMSFDATNGKGTLKKRATAIVENLK